MRWLNRAIALLDRLNAGIELVGRHASLTLVAAMTAIVLAQVFFRYVLVEPLTWSEEMARILMIWMTFLVAPIAYRQGHNVAIELFQQMLKGRALGLVEIGLNVLVLGFVVVFFDESLGLVERGMKIKAFTIEIQMSYVYAILPVSMAAMFCVGVEKLLKDVRVLVDPSYADTIAHRLLPDEAGYE